MTKAECTNCLSTFKGHGLQIIVLKKGPLRPYLEAHADLNSTSEVFSMKAIKSLLIETKFLALMSAKQSSMALFWMETSGSFKQSRMVARCLCEKQTQVWSLTQFPILSTFHNQGSVLKNAFSTNAQSRFASVFVAGVLGPQRLAQHT